MESCKFLSVHITDKLKRFTYTDGVVKKVEAEEIRLGTKDHNKLYQMYH